VFKTGTKIFGRLCCQDGWQIELMSTITCCAPPVQALFLHVLPAISHLKQTKQSQFAFLFQVLCFMHGADENLREPAVDSAVP